MKFFLITDNRDAFIGMRLAGADGVIVSSAEEARAAAEDALKRKDIGILMITEKLAEKIEDLAVRVQAGGSRVLLTVIPDGPGSDRDPEMITKRLKQAIGIKL